MWSYLWARIFSDSFSSFANSMFGKFSWKQQTDRCLNFTRRYCGSFVLMSKSWGLSCNSFKQIVEKRIHDAHCLGWNTNIWMNLFKNFVDVWTIWFFAPSSSLLGVFYYFSSPFFPYFSTFLRATFLWASLARHSICLFCKDEATLNLCTFVWTIYIIPFAFLIVIK